MSCYTLKWLKMDVHTKCLSRSQVNYTEAGGGASRQYEGQIERNETHTAAKSQLR